jgi:hypothetical protein
MQPTLEESLSITTGRCDLAIATRARKMHKNLFVVVHPEVLDNDKLKYSNWQSYWYFFMHFPSMSRNDQVATAGCNGQAFF